MLVLTILSIVPLSRQQAASPKQQPIGSTSSSWLGATLYVQTMSSRMCVSVVIVWSVVYSEHGTSHYEVSAQTQMRSQVPWLSLVLRDLQDTLQLTQDLIDKVHVNKIM